MSARGGDVRTPPHSIEAEQAVLGGLLLLHFVMLVYDIAARDEASTLYLYETSPGIILVAATALTGAWFSNAIFQVWRVAC